MTTGTNATTFLLPEERILLEKPRKIPTCCGRKISLCTCMSRSIFFTITVTVGIILLGLGLLALLGHFSSIFGANSFLLKLNIANNFVAAALGANALTIAIFITSLGLACVLTGSIGLCLEKNRIIQEKAQKKNADVPI